MHPEHPELKSVLVVRDHFRQELALQPFLGENGTIWCKVLESAEPYMRLKVALHRADGPSILVEILLPHDAVLMILVDAPDKSLGFSTIAQKP
jgi:hypothetical protein